MIALTLQNIRHIVRTKLLLVLLAFSFFIQFVGLRFLQSLTVEFNQVVSPMSRDNIFFAALFFQLFTGAFLAAAYGIWMVPYAHQGMRSQLTYTLPVARWKFACSYALSMLILLVLQHSVMIVSLGLNFGFVEIFKAEGVWRGIGAALLLQTAAFETCLFAFALSSLILGQIPTFFFGALTLFSLQVAGALLRVDIERYTNQPLSEGVLRARAFYSKLPPVGDLAFDMRQLFHKPVWQGSFWLWGIWFAVFAGLFVLKLRLPPRSRAGEN